MLDEQTEKEIQEYEQYLESLKPIMVGTSSHGRVEVYLNEDGSKTLDLGVTDSSILSRHQYNDELSLEDNIRNAEKELKESLFDDDDESYYDDENYDDYN